MGWVQESHVKEPLGFPTKIPTICRDSLVVSNNGLCTTLKMHHRSMRLMDNQFRLVHKLGWRKIRGSKEGNHGYLCIDSWSVAWWLVLG